MGKWRRVERKKNRKRRESDNEGNGKGVKKMKERKWDK